MTQGTPARPASTGLKFWQRPWALTISLSLWLASVCNAPLWREFFNIPAAERPGAWFAVVLLLMLCAFHLLLLSLFSWRYGLKAFAIVLLWLAGFGSYFMWTYHITIDATMLVNIVQTDVHEVSDLFNWRLPVQVLLLAALPSYGVWRWPVQFAATGQQSLRNLLAALLALGVFVLLLWAVFQSFSSTMRNHTQLRSMMNPLNSVYALLDLGFSSPLLPKRHFVPLAENAHLTPRANNSKPSLLVLVVGETARAANFSLAGYARETNPELKALRQAYGAQGFSYQTIQSCGTSTAISVPCMFSHRGRVAYGFRKHDEANLLDVLQSAGLAVLWLDNQSGCKGVCERVPSVDTSETQDPELCAEGECQDGILPKRLPIEFDKLAPERRSKGAVVVMHMMGSHGPAYHHRSPIEYKHFEPECHANVLGVCTQQALFNAYDNSLRYTDWVLGQTVAWLQTQAAVYNTALIYVSDHGESLGENNLYLHGMPYALAPDQQTQVPLITWLSPAMQQHTGLRAKCIQRNPALLTHDALFHSVLDLLDVSHPHLRKDWSWFANCRSG
jgi:lipid A ethanolaminephosphotransferase